MESGLPATSNSGSGGVEKGREKKNRRRRGEKKIRKKRVLFILGDERENLQCTNWGGGGSMALTFLQALRAL